MNNPDHIFPCFWNNISRCLVINGFQIQAVYVSEVRSDWVVYASLKNELVKFESFVALEEAIAYAVAGEQGVR